MRESSVPPWGLMTLSTGNIIVISLIWYCCQCYYCSYYSLILLNNVNEILKSCFIIFPTQGGSRARSGSQTCACVCRRCAHMRETHQLSSSRRWDLSFSWHICLLTPNSNIWRLCRASFSPVTWLTTANYRNTSLAPNKIHQCMLKCDTYDNNTF